MPEAPKSKYPRDLNIQLLIGLIFAESAGKNSGGENADEKLAIGATFLNMAYYAGLTQIDNKKCFNKDFGGGTLLSAINKGSAAYLKPMWNKVMVGNSLKPDAELAKLVPDDAAHLDLCVVAATALGNSPAVTPVRALSNKKPVNFNKAANTPSSLRIERIGKLGTTTFYGFKAGRECQ